MAPAPAPAPAPTPAPASAPAPSPAGRRIVGTVGRGLKEGPKNPGTEAGSFLVIVVVNSEVACWFCVYNNSLHWNIRSGSLGNAYTVVPYECSFCVSLIHGQS